jgi:hypothetical protein
MTRPAPDSFRAAGAHRRPGSNRSEAVHGLEHFGKTNRPPSSHGDGSSTGPRRRHESRREPRESGDTEIMSWCRLGGLPVRVRVAR